MLRTDLLRPPGFDRGVLRSRSSRSLVAAALIAALALCARHGRRRSSLAAGREHRVGASRLGAAWAIAAAPAGADRARARARAFVARRRRRSTTRREIAERLAALWRRTIGIDVRTTWWTDGDALVDDRAAASAGSSSRTSRRGSVDARRSRSRPCDLATMRLGALRPRLEALVAARGATLIVPLVDRGELVGLVEARSRRRAARARARARRRVGARRGARADVRRARARGGARARDRARGRDRRGAARCRPRRAATTSSAAGRSPPSTARRRARPARAGRRRCSPTAGSRCSSTEAQAHGVPAALATAALTGAFAAATHGGAARELTLDELSPRCARAARA